MAQGRGTEGEQKGGGAPSGPPCSYSGGEEDLFPGRRTNGGSQPPGPDGGLAK